MLCTKYINENTHWFKVFRIIVFSNTRTSPVLDELLDYSITQYIVIYL